MTNPDASISVGLLLTTAHNHPSFAAFCRCARQSLASGHPTYAYLLYDAVLCASHPELQKLQSSGLKIHACAEAVFNRKIEVPESIVLSGLGSLAQFIKHTGRFAAFSSHENSPNCCV
ncbi:MAG: DsrE family protein [Methylacidiphilales bacterium]|nr:DsrE family protein [Candidatus Methylacidiphilales bacterium]